jgi:hypothetical protein
MRRPVVLAVLSLAAMPAAEAQDRRPGEGLSITVRPRYSRTSTRKLGKVERRCTTFNKDGKRFALLTSAPKKEESESKACNFDPAAGQKECV